MFTARTGTARTAAASRLLALFLVLGGVLAVPCSAASNTAAPATAASTTAAAPRAAWADWDGDGQPDLYLARPDAEDRLLLSRGDELVDLSERAGIAGQSHTSLAVAIELDGRSPIDLVLLKKDGSLLLLRNLGGTFQPLDDDRAMALARSTQVTVDGETASLAALSLKASITTCVDGLTDKSLTSQCLKTSSAGAIGKLYPLSQDLNVSPATGALDAPAFTVNGSAATELLGRSVAGAGDTNGDGVEDFVAGASGDNTLASFGGRVTVYSGADASPLFSYFGDDQDGRLGTAVAGIGDVDGDGHDDVAAGEVHTNPGVTGGAGYVFVLSGIDGSLIRTLAGDNPGDGFGSSIAAAGDIDGDGVEDMIVGAPGASYGAGFPGYARIFSGATGALLFNFDGAVVNDQLGDSVAGLGDADGDGIADVAVGASDEGLGGFVHVYSGSDGSLIRSFAAADKSEHLGSSLAGVGDIDGDGLGDVLAGAPFDSLNTGLARVYSPASGATLYTLVGDHQGEKLGRSVAGTGDLTGDGVPDFLIGAEAGFSSYYGYARLFSGADGSIAAEMRADNPSDELGFAVGETGGHMLVSALYDSQAASHAGAVHLYAGHHVGMGTLSPAERLTVTGVVSSLTGGIEFPDGTVQVDDAEGPQGPQGPAGAAGAQGPQGPPALSGVLSINSLANQPLSIAGAGAVRVTAAGNTITLKAQPPTCTGAGKTYSEGAFCYFDIDYSLCGFGARAKTKKCQANGTWQVITSTECFDPSPLPLCGF
jgi:hypothetical protein